MRGDIGMRGNSLLTDTDLNAWANEIANEIAQRFRWLRTSATIDSVANQKEYGFPPSLTSLLEVYYNQLPLYPVQIADFQKGLAYWRRQGTGTPQFFYVLGNSGFGLHPTPGTSIAGGIVLFYEALPPAPVNDTDGYTVPFGGERAIISGVKLRAAEKDSSGEGRARMELYLRRHEEDMLMLQRAIESASEGEGTVIGIDDTPEDGGYYNWGFDPLAKIAGP